MEMSKIALAIISLVSLATVAHAQDSPQDFLNAHNAARASVGVGPMRWDNTVAAFARSYINGLRDGCRMVHSGGPYGENLAWGSPDLAGTAAVKMWVDERANYDYNSNSCVGGQCLHYTQVVWRNSVRLGCAKLFLLVVLWSLIAWLLLGSFFCWIYGVLVAFASALAGIEVQIQVDDAGIAGRQFSLGMLKLVICMALIG
ncbi:hypothetical protein POTOM_005798 [Populus tomentosa]|uniref:SCP domain-containing protein n=1 Tax=Populus tomentosa TaxID=118781 RepID=A0A8X8DFV8_POPTO|nr:hypothetical protein POTOM_005798 [Populus tomentosa]